MVKKIIKAICNGQEYPLQEGVEKMSIDFLLVGGGGGGGYVNNCCCNRVFGGGGGGGMIECCNVEIIKDCYDITIGLGGHGCTGTYYCSSRPDGGVSFSHGGDTCFAGFVACGGGAGAFCCCCELSDGGSGGGQTYLSSGTNPGYGIDLQGYRGGDGCTKQWGGGGGGAGGRGYLTDDNNYGKGGPGRRSDIGNAYFSGGGGAYCGCGGCGGGGCGINGCCNATFYGGGGGGGISRQSSKGDQNFPGGNGCQGIVIIRYKTSCGYTMYGGSKSTCGEYTYHCFLRDGQWTPTITPVTTPGIYHSAELGLISASCDGTNWITLADRNLGATQVYNCGDTIAGCNTGCRYQRGNNYGFSFDGCGICGFIGSQVDVSTYGPGNYYCCCLAYNGSGNWNNPFNDDLWGGVTDTVAAKQGPSITGYHIPTLTEFNNLVSVLTSLGCTDANWTNLFCLLKIPMSGEFNYQNMTNTTIGTYGRVWLSSSYNSANAQIAFSCETTGYSGNTQTLYGHPIRPFKNTGVTPDNSWNTL